MRKARWLTALLVMLAGGEVAHGQGILTLAPWGVRDFVWGTRFDTGSRRRLTYSLRLWSGPVVPVTASYISNPFVAWPATGVSVVSYASVPVSTLPPVVVIDRPRRDLDEERQLDLLLQRLERAPAEPAAAPAPPELPVGAPVSVFRPIRAEERERAQLPVAPKEAVPPPRPESRQEPRPLPGPILADPDPKRAHDQLVAFGKEAFTKHDYGQAERCLQRAISLPVADAEAYFLLAQAQFAQGKFQEAVAAIESGLRLKPDWPTSAFHTEPLYGPDNPDLPEQVKRLSDALSRYPDDANLLFLLGYQFWFDHRRDEARALIQKAKSLGATSTSCDCFLTPAPAVPLPM